MDQENKIHYANSKEPEHEKEAAKYNLIYTGKEEFEKWKETIESDLLSLKIALNLNPQTTITQEQKTQEPAQNPTTLENLSTTEKQEKKQEPETTNSPSQTTTPITQIAIQPEPLKENVEGRPVQRTKPRKRSILSPKSKKKIS